MSTAPLTHGEIKIDLAEKLGTNPSRYDSGAGGEEHRKLTAVEVHGIASALGMGLEGETKQVTRDAIMIRLGRDHRTGVSWWDAADLRAVHEALEELIEQGYREAEL